MEKKLENLVGKWMAGVSDKDKSPITRLCIIRVGEIDISEYTQLLQVKSVIIAVKLTGTRQTVRTAEINLEDGKNITINEEWRIQYQHFLKNIEANKMIIMIQRRKTYKNRKMLGLKTIASGLISLDEVYQRGFDRRIDLYPSGCREGPAKLSLSVSSHLCTAMTNEEFDNYDKISNFRQHKLMTKLLKMVTRSRFTNITAGSDHDSKKLQMIMNELDGFSTFHSLSDSRRPRLQPHIFHSSSSSLKSDFLSTDSSISQPPIPYFTSRSVFLESDFHLSMFFNHRELPSSVAIYEERKEDSQLNNNFFSENFPMLELPIRLTQVQIEQFMTELVLKLQQICDRSVDEPGRMRIALFVSESFLATFVRSYISKLSIKAPIWTSFFVFYYIPIAESPIAKIIASHDDMYLDCILSSFNTPEFVSKVRNYLSKVIHVLRIPIAEVMIPQLNDQFIPLVAELSLKFAHSQSSSDDDRHDVQKVSKHVKQSEELKPSISDSYAPKISLHVDISFDENKNDMSERLEKLLKKDGGKYTLKINVISFVVRNQLVDNNSLYLEFVVADKKSMLRINKPKESRHKNLYKIFGVTRIVCKSRSNSQFTVCVDNLETEDVTFMSINSQWRTNVKNIPFVVFAGNK